jgi:hypothetical protein
LTILPVRTSSPVQMISMRMLSYRFTRHPAGLRRHDNMRFFGSGPCYSKAGLMPA